MIPDPATSPLIWWRQVLFAVAVAILYAFLVFNQQVFGLFLARFGVCQIRGVSIAIYTRSLQPKGQNLPTATPAGGLAAAI